MIKQEPFLNKVNSFLNLLVLIYLLFEIFLIARIPSGYQASKKNEPAIPVTQNDLPDIYYIVPDCYPSASYQQEVLHFNNTAFEDSLKKAGFFLPKESSSNYNRTAFSMLSVFNMDYVKGVDTLRKVDAKNYALALHQLRSARVFTLLDEADYKLINLSIFDILNTKALLKQDFLAASPEEFFFSYSFAHYFLRDIYYTWLSRKSKLQKTNLAEKYEPVKAYNRLVIDTLLQHNFTSPAKPVFVYAHLNMPHYPYFFNATGEPFEQDSIYGKEMITSRDRFTAYIQYTNKQLLNIADAIRKKTNGKAVIIIQSDHGLYDLDEKRKADAFKNFTAVYFPDKNYASVPDTLSNVNSFRLVLNRYLQQKLPLIENKSYFISIR
ncbi:MAG: sulfatase-like hydrolase/transferase [Lacibacter sp.]